MPFTANRQFKARRACWNRPKGMYYRTTDGREVLDGCAGLWCVNAGHCRDEIVAASPSRLSTLDFAPTFQMGHPLAFEAATKVAELMPAGLDRIFFTNSGSESVDTALKIALAYHRVARRRPAHASDRPRARLSRRGLRRHFGGRHCAEPQDVLRRVAAGGRSSAAHASTSNTTRSRRASRPGARISPTNSNGSSRCMMRRRSPR